MYRVRALVKISELTTLFGDIFRHRNELSASENVRRSKITDRRHYIVVQREHFFRHLCRASCFQVCFIIIRTQT